MMKSDMDRMVKALTWYEKKYGPYIEKRGLQNFRNLFRTPNIYEWTILFMLIMAFAITWAYNYDTNLCRETMKNIDAICTATCSNQFIGNNTDTYKPLNLSGIIVKADNFSLND